MKREFFMIKAKRVIKSLSHVLFSFFISQILSLFDFSKIWYCLFVCFSKILDKEFFLSRVVVTGRVTKEYMINWNFDMDGIN